MSKISTNYSRRKFLSSISGLAVTLPYLDSLKTLQLEKIASGEPHNVIFILSDDHRYDFFGFTDKPKFLQTPNFDRLAQQGAHLQNTFVTTSLCSPSRASILTGKYPFAHGVVDNDSPMPEGNIFFPTYLQEAGYKTAFIGKWHMGNHTDEPQPGFNRWVSFPGQGVYYDPEFNIDGTHKKHTGYITDLLTDYAAEWINTQRNNRFFLYLSHKAVHAMFEPAKRHLGKYEKVWNTPRRLRIPKPTIATNRAGCARSATVGTASSTCITARWISIRSIVAIARRSSQWMIASDV